MSLDELSTLVGERSARLILAEPSQVCPKCASANALEVAQRMLSELGRPVPERHAAAYGHLETVLEMFTRLRLVLCGRHAAEFFRSAIQPAVADAVRDAERLAHDASVERQREQRAKKCPHCGRRWQPSMDENESYPGSACDQGVCGEGRDGD